MSNKALKTTDHFLSLPPLRFFFVWIESNKDPFLFDVIKLLRLDLGVRVNFFLFFFFPKHGGVAIRRLQMSGTLSSFTAPRSFFFCSPSLYSLPPRHKEMVGGRGNEGAAWKNKRTHPPTPLLAFHTSTAAFPRSNSPPYLHARTPPGSFLYFIVPPLKLPTCSRSCKIL